MIPIFYLLMIFGKDLCTPGSSMCLNNMLSVCDEKGHLVQTDCPEDTECNLKGKEMACVPNTKEKSKKSKHKDNDIMQQLLKLSKDKEFVNSLKRQLSRSEDEDTESIVEDEDMIDDQSDGSLDEEEDEEDFEMDSVQRKNEDTGDKKKRKTKKDIKPLENKEKKHKSPDKEKKDSPQPKKKKRNKVKVVHGNQNNDNPKVKTVTYHKVIENQKPAQTVTVYKTVTQKDEISKIDIQVGPSGDKSIPPNVSGLNGNKKPEDKNKANGNNNTGQEGNGGDLNKPGQGGNDANKPAQGGNGGGSSKPAQGGNGGGSSKPAQGGNGGGSSKPTQGGNGGGSSKPTQGGNGGGSSKPAQGGNGGGSSKPAQGGNGGGSSKPAQGGNGGGSSKPAQAGNGGGSSKPAQAGNGGGSSKPTQGGNDANKPAQGGNDANKPAQGGNNKAPDSNKDAGGSGKDKSKQGNGGAGKPSDSKKDSGGGGAVDITSEQISEAMSKHGYTPKQEYVDPVVKVTNEEFTDKNMAAMFLAQLAHESGGFEHIEEIDCAGSTKCADQYGGAEGAPGKSYHGRGFIQLSWPANYKAAGEALGMGDELFNNPDMIIEDPELAAKVSLWFWKENVENAPGVSENKFGATTKAINGVLECTGSNVDQSKKRFEIYKSFAEVLGITDLADEGGCY